MRTTILLKNTETGELVKMNMPEILEEINRDRSRNWSNYTVKDWKEGLEHFTEYTIVRE